MAMLSLGQAARLCGRGKTTLARMIRRGALSATRTEAGSYAIDPAELARAIPFAAPTEPAHATGAATGVPVHPATPDATADALVATLRETIADLKRERDDWKEQAMRLALPAPEPVSLWRWLRSTG